MPPPTESSPAPEGKPEQASNAKAPKSKQPRRLPTGIAVSAKDLLDGLQLRPLILPPLLALERAKIDPSATFVEDHWNEVASMFRQEGYRALLSMSDRLLKLITELESALEALYLALDLANHSEKALLGAAADGHPKQEFLPLWLKAWHQAEGQRVSGRRDWRNNEKIVKVIEDVRNAAVIPPAQHADRVRWHTEARATGEPAAYILTVSAIDPDGTPVEPRRSVWLNAQSTWGEALDAAATHRQELEQELIPLSEKDEAMLDLLYFRRRIVESVAAEYESTGCVTEYQVRRFNDEEKKFVKIAIDLIDGVKVYRSRTPLLADIETRGGWKGGRTLTLAKRLGAYHAGSRRGETNDGMVKTEMEHFVRVVRALARELSLLQTSEGSV